MKKILSIFVIGMLMLSLAACGSNQTSQASTQTSAKTTEAKAENKTGFEQFEDGLKKAGLTYKKDVLAAAMIGAEEGYNYKLSTGSVELFRFKENKALSEVMQNKSIKVEGFGSVPAEVYGKYVISYDTDNSADLNKKLDTIFKSIKQ